METKDLARVWAVAAPQDRLSGGPYSVVYWGDYWVVAALNWQSEGTKAIPSLGIRWMPQGAGMPTSQGHPVWFIIPSALCGAVLDALPIAPPLKEPTRGFLGGKISGEELAAELEEAAEKYGLPEMFNPKYV